MRKPERKRRVWKKTGGICAHCGRPVTGIRQTIDHFVPLSLGGGFDLRNLMPLCKSCNGSKRSIEVSATSYYSYAPQMVLADCIAYKQEWEERGKSAAGDMYNSWQIQPQVN